jgi:hypothetical protein
MAKDNANGNSNPPGPAIHLILQGKGGVGKSVVASWLAEFLIKRGQNVQCIDGDPVNRSLGQYKALRAEKLDLVNSDGLVQRTRYDACWRGLPVKRLFLFSTVAPQRSCRSGLSWSRQK